MKACLNSHSAVSEHLDLIVSPDERRRHGVFFVLCDEAGYPVTHAAVDDAEPDPTAEDCCRVVQPFATALAQADPSGRLLVAPTRPGSPTIGDVDRRWFHAVHATCGRLDIAVHGVYVVTPRASVQVHLDGAT